MGIQELANGQDDHLAMGFQSEVPRVVKANVGIDGPSQARFRQRLDHGGATFGRHAARRSDHAHQARCSISNEQQQDRYLERGLDPHRRTRLGVSWGRSTTS
ncbi:hypothetical protein [Chromohalobacter israelensis]|uniref:hypothetical protein n=1 Tax=Chromohalobacter israelensis TaxID=141390 RepID=UPI0015E84496|nr:hypothetical protein [Chromohalobacter salexigens]